MSPSRSATPSHDWTGTTIRVLILQRARFTSSRRRGETVALAQVLITPLLNHARAAAADGLATAADVDTAMRLGAGHPRGPFEIMGEPSGTTGGSDGEADPPERAAVIGTGTMATGIAEVLARAGTERRWSSTAAVSGPPPPSGGSTNDSNAPWSAASSAPMTGRRSRSVCHPPTICRSRLRRAGDRGGRRAAGSQTSAARRT